MRFIPRILVFAVAASVMTGISATAADEQKKPTKNDIPAAIMAAFQEAYPKATIVSFGQEKIDSIIAFEIESKDGDVERNILYKLDGAVVEIEETISASALPDAVKTAIAEAYPKGKIEKRERLTRGKTVEYEVLVEQGEAAYEIVASPEGKIVRSEPVDSEQDEDDEGDED